MTDASGRARYPIIASPFTPADAAPPVDTATVKFVGAVHVTSVDDAAFCFAPIRHTIKSFVKVGDAPGVCALVPAVPPSPICAGSDPSKLPFADWNAADTAAHPAAV